MHLMAIFAHPDDESFGPGGTLAKYAALGYETSLLTMTRGEAGTLGAAKYLTREELADLRSRELECAAEALGVKHLNINRLPDGQLDSIPPEKGKTIIRTAIERYHPAVVITFHPNGISGHPDHRAVTRWTSEVLSEQKSPPRLFYYGLTAWQVARFAEQRGLFPMNEKEWNCTIDVSAHLAQKIAAIECHASQAELWKMFEKLPVSYAEFAGREHFSLVLPMGSKKIILTDLFS